MVWTAGAAGGVMPRHTRLNDERTGQIVERLRSGCTRKAAAESIGVTYESFRLWLEKGASGRPPYSAFLAAVTHAEAEAEARNTLVLLKAATGWDSGATTTTRKTVFKTKETRLKDGTVIKEPVAFEEVSTSETRSREFDWKAALEWLKRRRRDEWGDGVAVRFEKMTDADLQTYIAGLPLGTAPEGSDSTGDSQASRAPAGAGGD